MIPVYNAHVIVHLCQQKNPLRPRKTEKIYHNFTNQTLGRTEGIRKDKIYSYYEDNGDFRFKSQINTALDVHAERTEAFQDKTKIIKTWARVLPENAQWHIKLTEHLGDGILLNHLGKISRNIEALQAPMSYFLIIEYFGNNRARITRKKSGDVFHGYSPCSISYRFSQKIHFVANQEDLDKPIVLSFPDKDGNFENEEFGKEFYPTRAQYFNVDFKDISINENKSDKEFNLDFTSDIASTTAASKLAEFLGGLGVLIDNFTEDDILYGKNKDDDGNQEDEPHHDPPSEEPGDLNNVRD